MYYNIIMKNKGELKTVRFSRQEQQLLDRYLEENPAIGSFSALARIAILDFMAKSGSIPLRPILREEQRERPSFLWDYDMSEGQVREVLAGPVKQRLWLVARILEHAKLGEVFQYLTPAQIERDLPMLRLPSKIREHWEYAIRRWKSLPAGRQGGPDENSHRPAAKSA